MSRHIKNSTRIAALVGCGFVTLFTLRVFAATTIVTNICSASVAAPVITTPSADGTTDNDSIIVEGTGTSMLDITIIDNGSNDGTTTVAPDGSYALTTPLVAGNNVLLAQATNACGITADSPSVTVYRNVPSPSQPPTQIVTLPQGITKQLRGIFIPYVSDGQLPTPPPSSTPNESGDQKPYITYPKSGSTVYGSLVWIQGQAQPGSVITVRRDGVNVAQVITSASGMFGVTIHLHTGKNVIQVSAKLGTAEALSDPITVISTQQSTTGPAPHPRTTIAFSVVLLSSIVIIGLAAWLIRHNNKER